MALKLRSKAGRKKLVLEMKAKESKSRGPPQAPFTAPITLLDEITWSVTTPPNPGSVFRKCQLSDVQDSSAMDIDDPEPMPSFETQLPCQHPGWHSSLASQCPGQGLAPMVDADLDEIVLKTGSSAMSIILLLPVDDRGTLSCSSTTLKATQAATLAAGVSGFTCRQLLSAVHQHYSEELSPSEQMEAMTKGGPHVRRALQVAFQSMAAITRGDLLGARCSFEGLLRCSRGGGAAVYELKLES
eukprot:gene4506-14666_t